jgi:hypothetical protein
LVRVLIGEPTKNQILKVSFLVVVKVCSGSKVTIRKRKKRTSQKAEPTVFQQAAIVRYGTEEQTFMAILLKVCSVSIASIGERQLSGNENFVGWKILTT